MVGSLSIGLTGTREGEGCKGCYELCNMLATETNSSSGRALVTTKRQDEETLESGIGVADNNEWEHPMSSEPISESGHVLPTHVTRPGAASLKALQRLKIKELRDALVNAGLLTLDAQAGALGLRRSTTWAILQANHKASGLSVAIINRMLDSPRLPLLARSRVLEYVKERASGLYGGSTAQCQRFVARLSSAQLREPYFGFVTGRSQMAINPGTARGRVKVKSKLSRDSCAAGLDFDRDRSSQ